MDCREQSARQFRIQGLNFPVLLERRRTVAEEEVDGAEVTLRLGVSRLQDDRTPETLNRLCALTQEAVRPP